MSSSSQGLKSFWHRAARSIVFKSELAVDPEFLCKWLSAEFYGWIAKTADIGNSM